MKNPNDAIRERIIGLLDGTGREGVVDLLQWMEANGYYEAPCSGNHHLAKQGGLAEHSLNVLDHMSILNESLKAGVPVDSIIICALLHDIGKVGQFGKPNYTENILKSGKKSEAKPYETNKDLVYEEHEIRSVIIASKFIDLTEDEQHAIIHHNGLWGKLDSSFSSYFDKNKTATLLHFADLWCSRFVEV